MVFPSGGDVIFTNFKYHLGSAYIIAYLRKKGFSAKQFFSNERSNLRECVKKILNHNPKIIGFTVYESNYMQCVLISKGLKAYNSNLIIIFGGPTPTVQSEDILESVSSVDICVRMEGEETLLRILKELFEVNYNLHKVDLSKIDGITYKNKNQIISNHDSNILFSNRETKNFLDKYPSPYISGVIPIHEAFPTGIITARGCNQNCIYCNCAVLSKRNIYFHSIGRVIEELVYLSEYKKYLGPVPILDDAFTIIPSRAKTICEKIIENNIKIPLLCVTRCDKINEELLDLMKEAGFNSIGFSLESAIPRILRTIGKVCPPNSRKDLNYNKETEFIKKFETMTSYAKKIGITRVFASIMVGLPGETFQDAQKTIELISRSEIDFYTHNRLHIFKGTPLYQNHQKFGYKINPIGKNNKVHLENSFPFNVNKLEIASNCTKIQNSKIIDYNTLKILALSMNRTDCQSFFQNVIINSNKLTPDLVQWLQENLAINGVIIQIYSNLKKFLKYLKNNTSILYSNYSPTTFYECYYWDDYHVLKPGRMLSYNQDTGLIIPLKNTSVAMKEFKIGNSNVPYFLCQDSEMDDIKALYNFLIEISKANDPLNYILDSNPLPQFENLCRWTNSQANCQKLETAIIEKDGSIRICWHSDAIGKVGKSFLDIKYRLEELKEKEMMRRNCVQCKIKDTCSKCLFPSPLSSELFCNYRMKCDTSEPSKILNASNLIKDLTFKPINLLDF
jgi:radical SAM protein with 4Fe4S-binding SPASM domain